MDDLLERAERLRAHIMNMGSGSGDAALIGELIERVRVATQWQPIETCPPEHVLFHGNTRHDARVVFTGWMGQNNRPYADNGDSVNPTHWMPIPAPPHEGDA